LLLALLLFQMVVRQQDYRGAAQRAGRLGSADAHGRIKVELLLMGH
jgi:hypothetical protein